MYRIMCIQETNWEFCHRMFTEVWMLAFKHLQSFLIAFLPSQPYTFNLD